MKRFLNTLLFLLLWLPSLLFGQMQGAATSTPTQFTPSLVLDFTKGTLPAGATFSRNSIGTYYNSSGYITTASANVARIDYDPVTLVCKGISVEESRTNRFINSSNVSLTTGHVQSNVTYTAGALGPDNALSSYTMTGGTGFCGIANSATFSYSTGSGYSMTWIVKPVSASVVTVSVDNAAAIDFTLTGAGSYSVTNSLSFLSASIKPIANGFYACYLTVSYKLFQKNIWYIIPAGLSVVTYGIQEEDGVFPTSYIPTGASAVTRATDYLAINSGTWYSKNESSVFVQFTNLGGGYLFSFNDGQTFQSEILATLNASNILRMQMPNGGGYANVTGNGIQYSPYTTGQVSKAAFGFNAGSILLAYNNNLVGGTATAMPVGSGMVNFLIGRDRNSTANFSGWIHRFVYYPKRLPNTFLQKLTQ